HFAVMNAGFLAPPIKLPFTKYGRAVKARDQLRAYIRERLDRDAGRGDSVLARLRAARTPAGEALGRDELEIETMHFFFAAYAVITGALVNLGIELADPPDARERARAEVRRLTPTGPLDLVTLEQLGYLDRVSKEVRRRAKLVPSTFFARVVKDCEFG